MILFPKVGRYCWYVSDIWEEFCVIPVRIEGRSKTPAKWVVRAYCPPNTIGHEYGYFEEFNASRRELYRTRKQAARAAAKFNKAHEQARQHGEY